MGTVVLSPKDCLPSTRNFQNSYLSSARSETGRRCFDAVMVPSPGPQDCVRNRSSGSTPGDGILPVPSVHGQARALVKKSSSSKASATSPWTSVPKGFHESSPLGVKSKLLRSASAILPTPTVGSPPLAEGLVNERLPLKVVQGNGSGNNVPKRVMTQRHRVCKRPVVARNRVLTLKSDDGRIERSQSTSILLQDDGAVNKGQSKETKVRLKSNSEKTNIGKGAIDTTEFPVVTILQRPKTDEAAMKLFAKFFDSGTQLDLAEKEPEYSKGGFALVDEKEIKTELTADESCESDSTEVSRQSCASSVSPLILKSGGVAKENIQEAAIADVGNVMFACEVRAHPDGDPLNGSKTCDWVTNCEDFASWERWAGPSYINSPPPSALPLPRFPKKLMKVGALHNGCVEVLDNVLCDQLSTSPVSLSPLYISLARQQHLNINADAVATATKDLKRILNLDLCRV